MSREITPEAKTPGTPIGVQGTEGSGVTPRFNLWQLRWIGKAISASIGFISELKTAFLNAGCPLNNTAPCRAEIEAYLPLGDIVDAIFKTANIAPHYIMVNRGGLRVYTVAKLRDQVVFVEFAGRRSTFYVITPDNPEYREITEAFHAHLTRIFPVFEIVPEEGDA